MPRFTPFAAIVLAIAAFVAPASAASAAPADASGLERATLTNGFSYALLPRTTEPGRISLRLIVHAGSLDEREDELGYAHFVEHMAFNGTRHYAPGKLVKFFERLGLTWGDDASAHTYFASTIYEIDLPAGAASHLGEALRIFRDFADGLEFPSREVNRQRGVILSELAARNTDASQLTTQRLSALYSGTLIPERFPRGSPDAIHRATADRLRAFYRRCYRPDRMTLLVVGDFPPDRLAGLVRDNFASLRATEPAPPRPTNLFPPPASGLRARVFTSPQVPSSVVQLISIQSIEPGADRAADRRIVAFKAALGLLDRRLAYRRLGHEKRFGRATASGVSGIDRHYFQCSLEVDAARDDWRSAVGVLETELRRARLQGFTDAEVRETSAEMLARVRAWRDVFRGLTAPEVANNIVELLAAGREWRSPDQFVDLTEETLAHYDSTVAVAALQAIFPDDRAQLCLTLPASAASTSETDVLGAWQASAKESLPATTKFPGASDKLVFRYTDFGPAVAPSSRETVPDLGLTLLEFPNGVRLNLRPSSSEPHRFHLIARLGHGLADLPRDRPGLGVLASMVYSACDLRRQTQTELRDLLARHATTASWSVESGEFSVELSGPVDALAFALQVLTAEIADVKLDPAKFSVGLSQYGSHSADFFSTAAGNVRGDTLFQMAGQDPRFAFPSLGEVEKYGFDAVASWLRARWLEGPLEIGLVGDFSPDTAIDAAARTVGTLSTRKDVPPLSENRLTFLTKPYRNINFWNLPDQAAAVRLLWPIRDAADSHTMHALAVATAALTDRLRVELRDTRGETYAPNGSVYHNGCDPNFGLVVMDLTFAPDRAIKLAEHGLKLADALARHGLKRKEFEQALAPLRTAAVADLRSNDWWLANVVSRAQSQPAVLAEARTHAIAFDDLTRREVDRIAAAHLRSANGNCVGFSPKIAPPPKGP